MQILTEMKNQYGGKFTEIYNALEQLINPPQSPKNNRL